MNRKAGFITTNGRKSWARHMQVLVYLARTTAVSTEEYRYHECVDILVQLLYLDGTGGYEGGGKRACFCGCHASHITNRLSFWKVSDISAVEVNAAHSLACCLEFIVSSLYF